MHVINGIDYTNAARKAGNLGPDEKNREMMLTMAIEAANQAYSPYSKFSVGAALLTTEGGVYDGCNVENIMYNGMSHAELTAITHAIIHEGPGMMIAEMVIWTPTPEPCPSCGGCRQLIREHASRHCVTYSYCLDPSETPLGLTVDELLPYSFGPENLG